MKTWLCYVHYTLHLCSVVFAGFSAEALKSRIIDGKSVVCTRRMCICRYVTYMYMYACWMCSSIPASASVVVTSDEAVRGGKTIPLKSIVDEAVEGCECVRKVFVSRRTGTDVPMTQRDIQLEEVRNTTTTPTGYVYN